MGTMFNFKISVAVDLDKMREIFETSRDIRNTLCRELGDDATALLYYIVYNGIDDLKAQVPSIDDTLDDPYATPNPDYGIEQPIYKDDDPWATPAGGEEDKDLPDQE